MVVDTAVVMGTAVVMDPAAAKKPIEMSNAVLPWFMGVMESLMRKNVLLVALSRAFCG